MSRSKSRLNKHQVLEAIETVAYSFPGVFHVTLTANGATQEYKARICVDNPPCTITVTENIWDYDKLILGVEKQLEITVNEFTKVIKESEQ